MAKKVVISVQRPKIHNVFWRGYLDEMPEEAKEKMKAEKPEWFKHLFDKK